MQTLAVSIFGAIITAVGVWIAMAQMVIARDRFEIDAFDRQYTRRVGVYEATRKFLEGAFRGTLSETDVRAYGLCTLDAQFLFDGNMYKYLRELCWRVTSWIEAKSSIDNLPPGENRSVYEKLRTEHLDWIIRQGDEVTGFATRFAPFLMYKRLERPWPFRLLKL